MREIYLLEVQQHNMKRYIGSISARDLVRLATTVELQSVQEAQRPINSKRLSEDICCQCGVWKALRKKGAG